MDPTSLASNVYSVAMVIYEAVSLAKSNKAQFSTLNQRIQEIVNSLQGLQTLPRTKAFYTALERLYNNLQEIAAFCQKFSGKKW